LYALNILEAILFKSSFITSFAFKENGIMNATGDVIKLIQLDETGHFAMTVNLLNRLAKDPEWIHIFASVRTRCIELYRNAIEADYAWIDYLFEDNVILLGISQDVLKEFVDYNAKIVMTSVGLEPFKSDVFNPCTWSNKYIKSSNVQTAQKEKISANYLLGKINMTTTEDFWKGL
jgi:ribonucleoside-diphosphate reductase beta chain